MHTLKAGDFVEAVKFAFYVLNKAKGEYMVIAPGVSCKVLTVENTVCTIETPQGIGTIIRYMDWKKV